MRALKVYGTHGFGPRGQMREIVATTSKKKAREFLNPSWPQAYALDDVVTTGNPEELRVALADPEVPYWRPLDEYREGRFTKKTFFAG